MRVTDVAQLARCSTATVSRVQNTPDLVAPETRQRVQAAVRKLGYMPNSAARALRSHRSRMIGTVIPTLNHAIFATFVEAIQNRLADDGCSLLVATFDYDLKRESEQAALLIERGAEGLILVGEMHEPELYRLFQSAKIPYINTYVYHGDSPHPCIGIDNQRAFYDIADFLVNLGHRHFGMITAATGTNDRAAARVTGVRQALAQTGLELDQAAIVERPYSIASGREGLRLLLARDPKLTAVVCGNDILACGAFAEAREIGLAVPDELSIVGFDNLDISQMLNPPLTTMEMPVSTMGKGAAEFLLDTLHDTPTVRKVRLEPNLIARRTTAAAPARD